ncbi:F-box/LRR-repeat protein 13-like [Silene latifolia]|uniref:F-box/LRR-repeat protein 13-like n=1 Tax=Silene latifolia TaxID=37657 RepID=UPI003D78A7CB
MTHITTPLIDRLIVECEIKVDNSIWWPLMLFWLRQACNRNLRELKLAFPRHWSFNHAMDVLPSFVWETWSLISVEICSLHLLLPDHRGQINLPNLKTLRLRHCRCDFDKLGLLIEACPSLQDLSLEFPYHQILSGCQIKIHNQNLRRLVISTGLFEHSIVVINAPKLEQLAACPFKLIIYRFEEKPSALREVEIKSSTYDKLPSEDESKVMSEFYGAISNVSFITLDDFLLDDMNTVLNATRVTLFMKKYHNIKIVPSLIEACPLLDVLKIEVDWDISDKRGMILPKLNRISTSRRVLKKIEIEAYWGINRWPTKSFLKLVRYLLSGVIELEQFHLRISGDEHSIDERLRQRMELDFCKLLCKCRMVIRGCEIEFVGMFHKYTSRIEAD